jgi:hypothetical protein
MTYYQFVRYPMFATRKIRIFKYWLKLMNTDNCILNGCYNYLYDMCLNNPNDTNNWVCCVRNEICRIGLNNLWHAQQS